MNKTFNAEYDEHPEKYFKLRSNDLIDIRGKLIIEAAINKAKNFNLCEIGSGTGNLALYIALNDSRFRIKAVEPLSKYVDFSKRKAKELHATKVDFINDQVENLQKYANELTTTSLFYSVDVVHHMVNSDVALERISNINTLVKYWVVIEPNMLNPYIFAFHIFKRGEKLFSPRKFLKKAKLKGWKCIEIEYFYPVPTRYKGNPFVKFLGKLSKLRFINGSIKLILKFEN